MGFLNIMGYIREPPQLWKLPHVLAREGLGCVVEGLGGPWDGA